MAGHVAGHASGHVVKYVSSAMTTAMSYFERGEILPNEENNNVRKAV